MDWQSLPKGFLGAVYYSSRFNFPLTPHEIWFWQVGTHFSLQKLPQKFPRIVKPVSRLYREKISLLKWQESQKQLPRLAKNPFVLAIFVTGSLAVSNCTRNDDIDLMIIAKPHSLWLARLWYILTLSPSGLRRPPHLSEHRSARVRDKLCDNLYLEYPYFRVPHQNLYIAHEILQAKPLYDPHSLRRQFLTQNSWVKNYLPVAYRETLKTKPPSTAIPKLSYLLLTIYYSLNLMAFAFQYLYMLPKITLEKISLHQAFFHPRQVVI